MVTNKPRKVGKYRGSTTHGCGSKKKNRGFGNKGGKGMAGSGKRASSKRPTILKLYGNRYFGKHGFKRPQKSLYDEKTINIGYIDETIENLVSKKLVENKAGIYIIDLKKLGYDKLLGKGIVKNKMKVSGGIISKVAKRKIEAKGGAVEADGTDTE